MRLAASNIAWDQPDHDRAATVLLNNGVNAVEFVHGKWFADGIDNLSRYEVDYVRRRFSDVGLDLVAMQSVMHGTPHRLFGGREEREEIFHHLGYVIRIAEILRIPHIVFGAVGCRRLPDGWAEDEAKRAEATNIAEDFFGRVWRRAHHAGAKLLIEPISAGYPGSDFLTKTDEVREMVARIRQPGVGLHLDIGTMMMNGENAGEMVRSAAETTGIAHVHASMPLLGSFPESAEPLETHRQAAKALRAANYGGYVSLEALAPQGADSAGQLASLAANLRAVRKIYA